VERTLNIIGAGHLGRTLGRLFAASGAFAVQDVLTRSVASAQDAIAFIGAGHAAAALEPMRRADAVMLAVSDDQIEPVCGAGRCRRARWRAGVPCSGAVVRSAAGRRRQGR
jgi:predicted dinucleotide-binding enzyme